MRARYIAMPLLLTLTDCTWDVEGDSAGNADAIESQHDPLVAAMERAMLEFDGEHGEPLPEFAAKCDIATGIHVPDFNCAQGTPVPVTHATGTYPNMVCDRPNRLNRECDPGSTFQIVAQSADAVAVANCRKKGQSGNVYGDIAVIQYNKANGAVCFYQVALATSQIFPDGNVRAPSRGTSLATESDTPNPEASPWLSTASTARIGCISCHDNGAILRSPYLSQLSILPGAGDPNYNRNQPVRYIGDDFQDWSIYGASIAGNTCTSCHRLGFRPDVEGGGTAEDFALRATATGELHKNPHSASTSPIWMPPMPPLFPGSGLYNAAHEDMAEAVAACVHQYRNIGTVTSGCTVSPISTPWTGISPASASVVLANLYL